MPGAEPLLNLVRDPVAIRTLARRIGTCAALLEQPLRIMEVCGGHTFAILHHGLDQLLPETVHLVHGPGCPVCVLPQHRIDAAIALAQRPDTILVTLGDMLRVPGSQGSLQQARAAGADVRYVYSPLDSLQIARANPGKDIIYFAIGFETTTPMSAVLLEQADHLRLDNLFLHSNHVLIPQAMELIVAQGGAVDAFIAPGHVSVMAGVHQYDRLATAYHRPVVIAGFEPVDILDAVLRILTQVGSGTAMVENGYSRFVRSRGNRKAQQLVARYFVPHDDFIWRGIGRIAGSALKIRPDFAHRDAEVHFAEFCPPPFDETATDCRCGAILMGLAQPGDCPLFGRGCTPQNPQGSCMVSNEGACAAYYRYRKG